MSLTTMPKTVPLVAAACLAVACASRSSTPALRPATTADGVDEAEEARAIRRRCADIGEDARRCAEDRACLLSPPIPTCSGSVCTDGGPRRCMACVDLVALTGHPRDLCVRRLAGRP